MELGVLQSDVVPLPGSILRINAAKDPEEPNDSEIMNVRVLQHVHLYKRDSLYMTELWVAPA